MKNLLLLIIAILLFLLVGSTLFISGVLIGTFTGKVPTYYKRLAIAIDCLGNVMGYPLFNIIFITKDGYKFGDIKDTISKVLGINKHKNTLKFAGKCLAKILNWIQKNHVEIAARDYLNQIISIFIWILITHFIFLSL